MSANERPKPETASVVAPGSSNPPPGDPLDEMLESFGEDRPAYASVRRESAGMRAARYNADPHAVPAKRLTPSWPEAKVLVHSSGQGRSATTAISRRAPRRLWPWALCSFVVVLVGGITAMAARGLRAASPPVPTVSVPSSASVGPTASPRSSSSSLVPPAIVEAPSVAEVKDAVKAPSEVKKRQAPSSATAAASSSSAGAESSAPAPVQSSAPSSAPASSSSSSDISHIM